MRNDRGYTYLITNGREYKIGITTKTPKLRLEELQTGSPKKLKISGYSYNSNALAMEIKLHKKFASKRLEGEWFILNDDDVAIIHHHFETDYIDEYFAPLSEKGIEAKKKQAAEKKRLKLQWKLDEPKRRAKKKLETEQRRIKAKERREEEKLKEKERKEEEKLKAKELLSQKRAKINADAKILRRQGKEIKDDGNRTLFNEIVEKLIALERQYAKQPKGEYLSSYEYKSSKRLYDVQLKQIHAKTIKNLPDKDVHEYKIQQIAERNRVKEEKSIREESRGRLEKNVSKYETYSTGVYVKDSFGNKILKPIEEEKRLKEVKYKENERKSALQKKREEDKYETYSTGVYVEDRLKNKILKPIEEEKELKAEKDKQGNLDAPKRELETNFDKSLKKYKIKKERNLYIIRALETEKFRIKRPKYGGYSSSRSHTDEFVDTTEKYLAKHIGVRQARAFREKVEAEYDANKPISEQVNQPQPKLLKMFVWLTKKIKRYI